MYTITHKGKLITRAGLAKLNKLAPSPTLEANAYLTHKTKEGCLQIYRYHYSGAWADRPKGVDCHRLSVLVLVKVSK